MSLRYSLAIFHRPGALRINSIWRPCARLELRRNLQYDCPSFLYAPACECGEGARKCEEEGKERGRTMHALRRFRGDGSSTTASPSLHV